MPFPLAHPAVVLPLRRVQWLSLTAMMLGCLTPDFSYGLPILGVARFAHSLAGSIVFCLPLGLLAYALFRFICAPLTAALPSPHRQVLTPLCHHPAHPVWTIVLSVWIGAASHVILDALTHESQMLVPHLVGLQNEIAAIERRGILFSRLLWLGLSALGLATLVIAYARLIRQRTGRWSWFDRRETGRYLVWLAVILGPLLAIAIRMDEPIRHWPWQYRLQHFIHDTMAAYLLVISLLVIGFGLTARLREWWLPRSARSQS